MTKRILLTATLALTAGLLGVASPAHAGQGTEQLIGACNFLLEADSRATVLQHGDFATLRAR